ncbi:hypothetical protein RIF29_16069 [Crotalaria pallida]|uniref:Uncharacterized protein n=1 Tax=Crotalaria pallida TaxID=3830 RepID=A0AAN9FI76_CROPI
METTKTTKGSKILDIGKVDTLKWNVDGSSKRKARETGASNKEMVEVVIRQSCGWVEKVEAREIWVDLKFSADRGGKSAATG